MPVQLNNQTPCKIPTDEDFDRWVSLVLKDQNKQDSEVSIEIVDRTEIQRLNREYRDKDKATNILSFEMELPEFVDIPLLGDLAICAEVVEQEAKEQNKPIDHHWAHLVIHGTLHLLGYDHIMDDEAEIMESLEIKLLQHLNIRNPYEHESDSTM